MEAPAVVEKSEACTGVSMDLAGTGRNFKSRALFACFSSVLVATGRSPLLLLLLLLLLLGFLLARFSSIFGNVKYKRALPKRMADPSHRWGRIWVKG